MVLLIDGTALAAGGYNGSSYLASSETYNPITQTWALTGPMTIARITLQMVLLSDGTLLSSRG